MFVSPMDAKNGLKGVGRTCPSGIEKSLEVISENAVPESECFTDRWKRAFAPATAFDFEINTISTFLQLCL